MNRSHRKRVVCIAVDGSDHSKRAVHWYIKEVYQCGDQVLFVHCLEIPHLPAVSLTAGLKLPVEEWTIALQENISRTTTLSNEYGYLCESRNIPYEFFIKNGSSPGVGIIEAAEEHHANLIVMGCRGLNRIKRAFIGSVSDYVVHNSTVPCITVPPNCN